MAQRARSRTATRGVRRSRPAARSKTRRGGLVALLEAHPLIAIGAVLLAGSAIASALIRPDPRRIAASVGPMLAPAGALLASLATPPQRHWREELFPGRRTWSNEAADQARILANALPPRHWWEEQIEQWRQTFGRALTPSH